MKLIQIALLLLLCRTDTINDLTIGWQNLDLLSHHHHNATLAPQSRQARASGENLNYVALGHKQGQVVKF